jgi:hypothetical protein
MAQTPANRILTQLREREAARAVRDAAVKAAHDAYFDAYPPRVEALLNDAADLAGLDERPPEPPKAPRTALLPRGEVNRLLGLLPPDLASVAKLIATPELKHLLISAKARRLGDHVATIDGEIGGRS